MRVRRTFAFLDLSGFTSLTRTQGDEQAVAVLGRFRALVRDVCSRRAVRIAKWLGDGAMLVSPEATPLLEAVLELQRHAGSDLSPLAIRCGASTGDVILLEGDDYIGHAVNLAARLCDMAEGKQVLANPEILEHIPPWATVIDTFQRKVRGIDEEVGVLDLGIALPGPGARPDPICGILLTSATAVSSSRDGVGRPLLFCSVSCKDTWDRRPEPDPMEQGSVRVPLIGS